MKGKLLKEIMAMGVSAAMVLGTASCGAAVETADNMETEQTQQEALDEPETSSEKLTESAVIKEASSIDFENGLYGFVNIDTSLNPVCDESVISVSDYKGSKALKVEGQGKPIYIGIQMDKLLGERICDVRTIEMTIGIENPDGQFGAVSGRIYGFMGEENTKVSQDWSVYLEDANPKRVTYTVEDWASFVEGNYLVVSLETDTALDKGHTPAILYIDDISFKDEVGGLIEADTSYIYEGALSLGIDRTGLYELTDVVEFGGFATSGDAWSQSGYTMPQEIIDALIPGAVVEITYTSESGDMWLVMNEADAGWSRIGQGDADGTGSDEALFNGTICQVTYEQIAKVCGDDVSTWGSMMQCESSGAWQVFSVSVGKIAN